MAIPDNGLEVLATPYVVHSTIGYHSNG